MEKTLKTMIDNMPAKTGKSLNEWKKVLSSKTFSRHSEAVNYLKKEHGVTHGFANTIVSLSKDQSASPQDLVSRQYQGKENLHPIYEELVRTVRKFGEDVRIAAKKTEVSLDRKKKFAVIRPSTKSRIDLGLKLKGVAETDRLEHSGPFGTMCTHRVRLTHLNDIDAELIAWLQEAYERAI